MPYRRGIVEWRCVVDWGWDGDEKREEEPQGPNQNPSGAEFYNTPLPPDSGKSMQCNNLLVHQYGGSG